MQVCSDRRLTVIRLRHPLKLISPLCASCSNEASIVIRITLCIPQVIYYMSYRTLIRVERLHSL